MNLKNSSLKNILPNLLKLAANDGDQLKKLNNKRIGLTEISNIAKTFKRDIKSLALND